MKIMNNNQLPKILCKLEFRFLRVKQNQKNPLDPAWQNPGMMYDSTEIQSHIQSGGNVGIIGGYGRLRLLDIDKPELAEQISKVLKTFTVQSGKGGRHFYILSDYDQNHVLGGGQGELRANMQFVLCPPSIHPNGTLYKVVNDVPIIDITGEGLSQLLEPFFKLSKVDYNKILTGNAEIGERNDGFFRTACLMRFNRIKKEQAAKIIKEANSHTQEPLSTTELNKIIENAYKYTTTKQEEPTQTSSVIDESKKIIVEQCHKDGKSFFVVYDAISNKITTVEKFNGYVPIVGEEIIKGAVMLPSEAVEYVSEIQLDQKILAFIDKWLDISSDMRLFCLWNIKRSWLYEKFHTLNYLRALGDTGRGKSRFLDVNGVLHYKPIWTAGATTPAPIFRLIEKWKGTLVLDEADLKVSDETADLIKIINMGYERGKFVIRCDQNDASKISFFNVYCPKILATRRTFDDKAVEGRCITEVMRGTTRTDIKFSLTKDFYSEALQIRDQLLMYRFRNYFKIVEPTETPVVMQKLEPRLQQIVSSFISLFYHDKKQWATFERYILEQQGRLVSERQESFEGQIVGAVFNIIERDGWDAQIDAGDIIMEANLTDRRGNQLKPRALSSSLRALGFGQSKVVRIEKKTKRLLPLESDHLNRLFSNFGYDVTMFQSVTDGGGVGVQDEQNTLNKKMPCPHNNRNLRNTVTTKTYTQNEVISYFEAYDQADNYQLAIDIAGMDEKVLKSLIAYGRLFEHKPGWLKVLK